MNHLTGIASLSDIDIRALLDRADAYANGLRTPDALRGKIVMTLFFENSTRTRVSFEMAAKRLGADVVDFETVTSSLSKGETFLDTILTLKVMNPDAIIIRHGDYGTPDYVAKHVNCPVINAGDSWREHPTQALLDALTIRRALGKIEGATIAICGDVAHSRVAASNIQLLSRLGAQVRVIAPEFLMPQKFAVDGVQTFTSMETGLPGCDIVMMLRNQKERMQEGSIPDDLAFHRQFGLTTERLALTGKKTYVMHPGPMNRGVEIADDVADDKQYSLIQEQVRLGVFTRMAVLDLLVGDKK